MQKNMRYCHDLANGIKSFYFDHVHIFWNEQISLYQQENWKLSYVITGKGVRIIGDLMEPFSSGEIILIPPDIPHCWSFDSDVCDREGKIENVTITFTGGLLESMKMIFPELIKTILIIQKKMNAVSFENRILSEIQELMKDMILQTNVERLSSLIKLFELISSSENENIVGHPVIEDKHTKKIRNIHLYVMNNYQNSITLDEIACLVDMERSSFCVFFKKMTGKSFFSFLTEYRIESSCRMLTKTNKSIAEICFASGFRDVPYYNRIFRKKKETTPTQYRISKSKL